MPSSSKTSVLGLNQFVGSDKPKMDDFNYDNNKLETLVGGHLEDGTCHLTAAERERYLTGQTACLTYTGDGSAERTVELPFAPAAVLAAAVGVPFVTADPSSPSIVKGYAAAASPTAGASAGAALSGSTLTVYNDADSVMAESRRKLNAPGVSYLVVLWR